MSRILGGSKQKHTSTTSNQAFDTINQAFSPMLSQGVAGANALSALLGGDTSGLRQYQNATGFDAAAEAGSRGITGNAAASGLLRSGGTGKALQAFGQDLQNQYTNQYIDRLLQQANLGLNAGGLLANAGQQHTSQGKSSSKKGLGGLIGAAASGVAVSDRRLKKNIHKIGKTKDGLSLYQYRYIDGSGPHIGVMADEVAKVVPEALGPVINGYQTVDYSKLQGVAL